MPNFQYSDFETIEVNENTTSCAFTLSACPYPDS